jgi:hypothetical protein
VARLAAELAPSAWIGATAAIDLSGNDR